MLGVAAIAGIGSLAASVVAGIKGDARDLLGGDAEVRLAYRQVDAAERAFLAQAGRLSEIATMRAMARTQGGDRRSLIELKAVDPAYPLYGMVALVPAQSLGAAPNLPPRPAGSSSARGSSSPPRRWPKAD